MRKQLDSVLAQTVQDLQIVICDDCSSDSTMKILDGYAAKDSRIQIFHNEKNLGFKKNFEKAISLCSGEYIALCDQDDIWLPHHLTCLMELIGDHDIACGNAELINEHDRSMGMNLNETCEFYHYSDSDLLIYKLICARNPFQGGSMLIRKSFFDKVLPVPDNIPYHDSWFSICSCFKDRIKYTFEVITRYRIHQHQITVNHKQNLFNKLIFGLKKIPAGLRFKTDRFDYISEVRKRFEISDAQNKILEECIFLLRMRVGELGFRDKLRGISILNKNYENIYTYSGGKYRYLNIMRYFIGI